MPLGNQNINFAQSLQQLRQGGLPTRAQLRLQEEAGPHKKLFTSDLTVNEFLTTREVGTTPISQVMGSSIYHIGQIADYKGATGEIDSISQAHREARQLALRRLWLEAQAVNADAVVGVRLGERYITVGSHGKGGDDGGEVIEFTVVGTAVKAPWMPKVHGTAVVTDLSGQDMWALAREGYAPCGMIFDFCRYHVWHVMKQGFWTAGGEVTSARDGVEQARRIVESRVRAQAERLQAEFVVGSDLNFTVNEVPCGYGGCPLNDLDVDVNWFGTGIRRIPNSTHTPQNVPPLILGMMPLGKRKADELLEGESDSDKLKELAKRLEEEASKEGGGGE
jgi:uncharacterized protein YbjQ (UPF0145 family)